MIDQRIKNVVLERPNGFTCHITGNRFGTFDECYQHSAKVVEAIDKAAGHIVSEKILRCGFPAIEDQDLRGQVARDRR